MHRIGLKVRTVDLAILCTLVLLGFIFLKNAIASFNYNWDWARAWGYFVTPSEQYNGIPYFVFSIFNTLKITAWVTAIAIFIGLIGGLARTSRIKIFRILSTSYVGTLRNLPPLVSLFIFNFFIAAQITPLLPLESIQNWLSEGVLRQWLIAPSAMFRDMLNGIIALSIIEGAFITEIVRGGMKAIPKGQNEAGQSLGLSTLQTLRHVLIPQLLRIIRLPLGNSSVSILKNTAILSLISVNDLTFAAQDTANSGGPIFEIWILTAAIYLVLCLALDGVIQRVFKD